MFFLPFIQCQCIMDILMLILVPGERGLDLISFLPPSNPIQWLQLYISGSGKQNGLNELGVDIIPKKKCKSMWGRVDIDVLDQQVCVGYGDTGACYVSKKMCSL